MKRRLDISEEISSCSSKTSFDGSPTFTITKDLNVDESTSKKRKVFPYGNYTQYYGYRNPSKCDDERLSFIPECWIRNKAVLDVGCNSGHLTLSLARKFKPSKVDAIDIDKTLIAMARRNISHYESKPESQINVNINNNEAEGMSLDDSEKRVTEYAIEYGGNVGHRCKCDMQTKVIDFKLAVRDIVSFSCANFVLNSDMLLDMCRPEYDVIMMLSVSKWIHLNFGDDGLKRCFARVFKQLKPGGVFLLEPQPFESYRKKKKVTQEISKVFQNIQFFPKQFHGYLIGTVGFTSSHVLKSGSEKNENFQEREIVAYFKGGGGKYCGCFLVSSNHLFSEAEETMQ